MRVLPTGCTKCRIKDYSKGVAKLFIGHFIPDKLHKNFKKVLEKLASGSMNTNFP